MTATVEVWVLVDAAGEVVAGTSEEQAAERYGEEVGELAAAAGFRMVKLTLTVPLPKPIEITATVADAEEVATVAVG